MPLYDEIDGPTEYSKKLASQRSASQVRHIFFLQLFTLIIAVLIGNSEVWGYSEHLLAGSMRDFFFVILLTLMFLCVFSPISVFLLCKEGSPPERLGCVMVPLSVLLSIVQTLALLPLVQ